MNAIGHKEIFPLIKNNKLWMGVSFNKSKWFKVTDDYEKMDNASGKEENGEKYILVKSIAWFTNMEHNKKNEPLILTKKYDPALYPKYDNYDAIEISKTCEIPMGYDGVMGVPISFLDKYCPTQFEIIDINPHFFSIIEKGLPKPKQLTLNGVGKKDPYARILIKKK